ncbi:DMT family transporter [Hwanghaeella grinnelliae]|uniref:DMT family transporter n=1 Tax=Hwanghaeella grinnelliae TaxID=2500179 RepID=A0A437QV01_9PROT|nr:DMT family transporter [Hwanghaeella grinnelliae]RVU38266.1 DMT family transporter [Hwanghaeella grinnelliae]
MAFPISRPALPEDDNIPRGIFLMLTTTLFFVLIDTSAKHLSQSLPVMEVVWARFIFHLVVVLILLRGRVFNYARTNRPGLQLFRSTMLMTTTYLFFTGVQKIDLAMASSIMFLSPILITVLSVPILGERIGLRRVLGVLAGLVGALIIVRPGLGEVPIAAFYFIAAACTNALYQLTTRVLRQWDDAYTTLFYTGLVGAVVSSVAAPAVWVAPSLTEWGFMAAMGTFGALGHFTLIRAFQSAPPSALMPFAYSGLVWATLFGYFVFSNLPDGYTVIGAAIITASGVYIFHREQRVAKAAAGGQGQNG